MYVMVENPINCFRIFTLFTATIVNMYVFSYEGQKLIDTTEEIYTAAYVFFCNKYLLL